MIVGIEPSAVMRRRCCGCEAQRDMYSNANCLPCSPTLGDVSMFNSSLEPPSSEERETNKPTLIQHITITKYDAQYTCTLHMHTTGWGPYLPYPRPVLCCACFLVRSPPAHAKTCACPLVHPPVRPPPTGQYHPYLPDPLAGRKSWCRVPMFKRRIINLN